MTQTIQRPRLRTGAAFFAGSAWQGAREKFVLCGFYFLSFNPLLEQMEDREVGARIDERRVPQLLVARPDGNRDYWFESMNRNKESVP